MRPLKSHTKALYAVSAPCGPYKVTMVDITQDGLALVGQLKLSIWPYQSLSNYPSTPKVKCSGTAAGSD